MEASAKDQRQGERAAMVEWQLAQRGVGDPRVLSAMGEVPRELFLPIGTEEFAYQDSALPIDQGQTISQPYIVALMTVTLQYYGSRRIAEAISEDIALAAYFGEKLAEAEDFELLAPVELSICCFRYIPKPGLSEAELDRLNERIMGLVQKGGRAYVSNATVNGRFALRACITNFRTTKADIDETIQIIREAGRA
jgi:glutamate/tyrosine decarboxylase-like PLP-dependent enzyme